MRDTDAVQTLPDPWPAPRATEPVDAVVPGEPAAGPDR
jgi:hypothetical protein